MAIVATILALAAPAPASHHAHCDHWCHHRWRIVRPYNAKLERMAGCESTWRWHLYNPPYSGGLQFTLATWHSVGGRGYPHQNSRLEQKYRAVKVYKRRGSWADWPVCGYV